jgi:ABC-type multidrug transport system permease subunit
MSFATLVRADFNERSRRFSFFVFVLAALGIGWLAYAGHIQMAIGRVRGVLNSAWIGTTMAVSAGVFVTMVGFYVVKNALENDRRSGVGEILCATRLDSLSYLLSKWASNALVLSSVLALLVVVSAVMQVVAAESDRVDLVALLAPMVMLGMPSVCVVAALAVVFETVPLLRGGFGNVFYFFFWSAGMGISLETKMPALDWLGFSFVESALKESARTLTGTDPGGFSYTIGGGALLEGVNQALLWDGIRWTPSMIATRLAPVAMAMALVALSSLWFDRFDPSRGRKAPKARRTEEGSEPEAHVWEKAAARLSPPRASRRPRLVAMTIAETRVMLARTNRWWALAAAIMAVALLFATEDAARGVLIAATLWPVLFWSKLGMRERWHGTDQILFSAPHPIRGQLVSSWLAGVALSCLTTGTWGLRMLVTGELAGFSHWVAGAAFVPALALALGVWSGTSRLFESIYVALWYVGIANATRVFDFIGASPEGSPAPRIATYAGATVVLVGLAAFGRKRQIDE